VAAGRSSLGVMPTGSGKSLVIAALMAQLAEAGRRSLLLTHVRELVEQDTAAFRRFAPEMDHGVFCRGLGRFELAAPVAFAQTQSLHARKHLLTEPFDVVIVDEAHLIPFSGEGRYVSLIRLLRELRPGMPLAGLTATPFRLQGGWLHKGPDAWFEDIAYEISVLELIQQGYLAPLTGRKPRDATIDTAGLRIERGDYRESDLVELVDDDALNRRIADEIVRCGQDRRAWLVFAVGVDHAHVLRHLLEERGIAAGVVLGGTPKAERDQAIAAFRSGRLRALINVNVLTTGFDAPELDLIAVARPTASTSLHVQMLGRGTRIAEGKRDCLVLDFAGNVQRLGPITAPRLHASNQREADGASEPPVKVCPACDSYIDRGATRCEHCGFAYEAPDRRVGDNFDEVDPLFARPVPVEGVTYAAHHKPGRPASLRITYRLPDRRLSEWLCLFHPGYAGEKGRAEWLARGGGRVPANIEDAVRLAPAVLRRPPEVTITETNDGFPKPAPVWG
jgi:DNA repair protein RadD